MSGCEVIPGFTDAQTLLGVDAAQRPTLNFLRDDTLDYCLSSALNAHGIVEVYGPSGAGKSTLAMQAAASFLKSKPDCSVLYIYSGKPFSMRRFEQILCGLNMDVQSALAKLVLQHAGDLDSQSNCLSVEHLDNLASATVSPVRMLIVDSISANFRVHKRTRDVSFRLQSMVFAVQDFAKKYNAYVLCTNEVSSQFFSEEDSYVNKSQAPSGNDLSYKPALGLAWSNSVSTRIEMKRKIRADASDIVGPDREIIVHRSNESPFTHVRCRLCDNGLQGVDSLVQ